LQVPGDKSLSEKRMGDMNQPAKCVYQDKEGDLKSQRLRSIPWILVNNFYDGCTGHKEGKATHYSIKDSIEDKTDTLPGKVSVQLNHRGLSFSCLVFGGQVKGIENGPSETDDP
jgi:hypothetical protein